MTRSEESSDRAIALIGAPADVGAGARGGSMGPEAMRVAGIEVALGRLGRRVLDLGNLSGPSNPNGEGVIEGNRHLEEVTQWCRSVRGAVQGALRQGRFPILLGGDHSLAIGSIAGIAAYCAEREVPLSVLWLDAHADFNTPATTLSGNLHGMPVAVLTGAEPAPLTTLGPAQPIIEAARIIQLGVRSVDHAEKALVIESGLEVNDMRLIDERGMRKIMDGVLGRLAGMGRHVHVSFDVDFLDPSIAPGVATTVAGGPTYREAQLCMEMIYDSGLMGSLDIMELNPAYDDDNRTARLVVELVESLFGEQILSRHRFTL